MNKPLLSIQNLEISLKKKGFIALSSRTSVMICSTMKLGLWGVRFWEVSLFLAIMIVACDDFENFSSID
jgi:hypothetical protein